MLFLKERYIEKPYESVMEISQSPKIQEPFKKLNFQRHTQGGNHWTAWNETKKTLYMEGYIPKDKKGRGTV